MVCEILRDGCFDGLDLAFIDVDDPLSAEWAPRAAAAGATVIDKSAAFRMDPDVPLVISEVNPEDVRVLPKGIVSCPNCTTMVLVTALAPLHRAAGIERMVVSTYQAVSGAGQAGLDELAKQWNAGAGTEETLRRAGATPGAIEPGEVWDRPIAGNVIPLAGSVKEAGYTSEEWKLVHETRKILHAPDLRVSGTCVRVPVYVGHSMAANVQFSRPLPRAEAAELLAAAGGVTLVDGGDGSADRARGGRDRPGARRAPAGGPVPGEHPRPLGHGRQPPQGRGPERRPARGADRRRLKPGFPLSAAAPPGRSGHGRVRSARGLTLRGRAVA